MDATELTEIDAAFTELFDVLAGDPVTAVDAEGTETDLVGMRWEPDSEASRVFEGLKIDAAGMQDQQERNVLFLKSYLAEQEVDIVPTMSFLIDGERWDLAEGRPIRRDLAPLGGWQGLLMITIRKAVEINKSATGTTFTYEP
jgi:hypothetical protein